MLVNFIDWWPYNCRGLNVVWHGNKWAPSLGGEAIVSQMKAVWDPNDCILTKGGRGGGRALGHVPVVIFLVPVLAQPGHWVRVQAVVVFSVSILGNLNSYPRPFWHIWYNLLEHAGYPSHRVFSLEQNSCYWNLQAISPTLGFPWKKTQDGSLFLKTCWLG